MAYCTACGAEYKQGAKFCGECGQAQKRPVLRQQHGVRRLAIAPVPSKNYGRASLPASPTVSRG